MKFREKNKILREENENLRIENQKLKEIIEIKRRQNARSLTELRTKVAIANSTLLRKCESCKYNDGCGGCLDNSALCRYTPK